MSSTATPVPAKPNVRLFFQLRKMVTNPIDLLDASSSLGISPSTLRKILGRRPDFTVYPEKNRGRPGGERGIGAGEPKSACGLFEYKASRAVGLPREKILEDYRQLLTLKGVAQVNRISPCCLHRLLKVHRITHDELEEIWFKEKRAVCIELNGMMRWFGS